MKKQQKKLNESVLTHIADTMFRLLINKLQVRKSDSISLVTVLLVKGHRTFFKIWDCLVFKKSLHNLVFLLTIYMVES